MAIPTTASPAHTLGMRAFFNSSLPKCSTIFIGPTLASNSGNATADEILALQRERRQEEEEGLSMCDPGVKTKKRGSQFLHCKNGFQVPPTKSTVLLGDVDPQEAL